MKSKKPKIIEFFSINYINILKIDTFMTWKPVGILAIIQIIVIIFDMLHIFEIFISMQNFYTFHTI